jgi:hypothetical protein
MAKPTSGAVPVARSEPRTRTALLLEGIALRHQIAVLEQQRNSSPVLSPLGSAVLDLVLALVAPMARQPDYCRAGDGLALAPKRLVSALAILGGLHHQYARI